MRDLSEAFNRRIRTTMIFVAAFQGLIVVLYVFGSVLVLPPDANDARTTRQAAHSRLVIAGALTLPTFSIFGMLYLAHYRRSGWKNDYPAFDLADEWHFKGYNTFIAVDDEIGSISEEELARKREELLRDIAAHFSKKPSKSFDVLLHRLEFKHQQLDFYRPMWGVARFEQDSHFLELRSAWHYETRNDRITRIGHRKSTACRLSERGDEIRLCYVFRRSHAAPEDRFGTIGFENITVELRGRHPWDSRPMQLVGVYYDCLKTGRILCVGIAEYRRLVGIGDDGKHYYYDPEIHPVGPRPSALKRVLYRLFWRLLYRHLSGEELRPYIDQQRQQLARSQSDQSDRPVSSTQSSDRGEQAPSPTPPGTPMSGA